jgi:hypothetical protein
MGPVVAAPDRRHAVRQRRGHLGGTSDRADARSGLLVIAGVVGLVAMAGVRAINEKSIATPWLLAGLLPAAVGWYFVFVR